MTELRNDQLVFRFPDVHADAVCRIGFQRTLRIPDDNRDYPLPPGLGRFPLRHVDDHLDQVPEAWDRHGGVFLPMYQAEAMWLQRHAVGYASAPFPSLLLRLGHSGTISVFGRPFEGPEDMDKRLFGV